MNTPFVIQRAITASAAILLLASHVCAGETAADNTRGFTLTLPDGFVANSELIGAAPEAVDGFVLGDPTDNELDIVLFIERMRGTIGRKRLTPDDFPPGFQGRVFTTRWQGFDIDGIAVPEQVGQIKTITYNVQIPLQRAAIQVKLFGPADRESELKSLLAETLAGLKGESSWIPSAMPYSPVTSSKSYRFILLAFAVLIILAGLVALWLVSRSAPKGTVFAIAVGIYIAGSTLTGIRIREVMLLEGTLRMLGFAGGILGIIDLVRRGKARDKNGT